MYGEGKPELYASLAPSATTLEGETLNIRFGRFGLAILVVVSLMLAPSWRQSAQAGSSPAAKRLRTWQQAWDNAGGRKTAVVRDLTSRVMQQRQQLILAPQAFAAESVQPQSMGMMKLPVNYCNKVLKRFVGVDINDPLQACGWQPTNNNGGARGAIVGLPLHLVWLARFQSKLVGINNTGWAIGIRPPGTGAPGFLLNIKTKRVTDLPADLVPTALNDGNVIVGERLPQDSWTPFRLASNGNIETVEEGGYPYSIANTGATMVEGWDDTKQLPIASLWQPDGNMVEMSNVFPLSISKSGQLGCGVIYDVAQSWQCGPNAVLTPVPNCGPGSAALDCNDKGWVVGGRDLPLHGGFICEMGMTMSCDSLAINLRKGSTIVACVSVAHHKPALLCKLVSDPPGVIIEEFVILC